MSAETQWEVPAITAGTPQTRDFSDLAFSEGARSSYRTEIKVDNSRGSSQLTVRLNGMRTFKVAAGAVSTLDPGRPVYFYTVDAAANTALGDVIVYENGGLNDENDNRPTSFDR